LLALIAFPLWIEPRMGASAQSRLWMGGYAGLILMVLTAATLVWKQTPRAQQDPAPETPGARPPLKTCLYWLAAACIPSALMLAVTTHISTDLASVPFLWIIPLAIYLLTFILAFSNSVPISAAHVSLWSAPLLLLLLPIIPDVAAPGAALNWSLMAGH